MRLADIERWRALLALPLNFNRESRLETLKHIVVTNNPTVDH